MIKPNSLRAAITAVLPELARDPERLAVWADQGAVRSTLTRTNGFTVSYKVEVFAFGLDAGKELSLFIGVLNWLRIHQPLLLTTNADAFTFEIAVLDGGQVDMNLMLTLSESVSATQREDGGFKKQVQPEPNPLFADDLGHGGTNPVPNLTEIWLNGGDLHPDDLIAPDPLPLEPTP